MDEDPSSWIRRRWSPRKRLRAGIRKHATAGQELCWHHRVVGLLPEVRPAAAILHGPSFYTAVKAASRLIASSRRPRVEDQYSVVTDRRTGLIPVLVFRSVPVFGRVARSEDLDIRMLACVSQPDHTPQNPAATRTSRPPTPITTPRGSAFRTRCGSSKSSQKLHAQCNRQTRESLRRHVT